MSIPDSLHLPLALVTAALAGRLLIACLPADAVDRRQLPVTWAAALYLGWAALAIEMDLAGRAGVAHRHTLLALPWLGLAAFRWLTLPGAMSPRHAPREAAPGLGAHLLGLACLAWLGFLFTRAGRAGVPPAWPPAVAGVPPALHLTAIAAFTLHALRVTRRSRAARLGLSLALVMTPALWQVAGSTGSTGARTLASAVLVAGAAFSFAWLRRANRRALVLACASFALLPLSGAAESLAMGVASLAALVAATPRPGRRKALEAALLGLGVHTLHYFFAGCPAGAEPLEVPLPATLWAWWALGLFSALRIARPETHEPADEAAPIDAPRREHVFVLLQLVLCSVAATGAAGFEIVHFIQLTPIAALSVGLALPRERA